MSDDLDLSDLTLDQVLDHSAALIENPRATGDNPICGATVTHGTSEFICIREPHLNVYRVKKRSGYTGERVVTEQEQAPSRPAEAVQGDRHYFVGRWVRKDAAMARHYAD